jgi:hypothetical protein
MEEKSDIQKVVDLLEKHGYYIFKFEEEMITPGNPSGLINLQICPRKRYANPFHHD